MTDPLTDSRSDLLDQIPDPDTVRGWLAESIRRCDLLRSLLRVAVRKASYQPPSQRSTSPTSTEREGVRHGR